MDNVSNNPSNHRSDEIKEQSASDIINIEVPRPTHEEIATMAYYIWLSEGCPEGCAERHWFEAETQLIRMRQAEALERLKEQTRQQVAEQTISASPQIATARSSVEESTTNQQQTAETGSKKRKRKVATTAARACSNKTARGESQQSV
ncbi:MAG: DUF2934 domain-containing protein [Verrucomicrobiia bacterium]